MGADNTKEIIPGLTNNTEQLEAYAKDAAKEAALGTARSALAEMFGPLGSLFNGLTNFKKMGFGGEWVTWADDKLNSVAEEATSIVASLLSKLGEAFGFKSDELPTIPKVGAAAKSNGAQVTQTADANIGPGPIPSKQRTGQNQSPA